MDLYCQRCGEPWEHYYVMHEMSSGERQDFLNGGCCPSCAGKPDEELPKKKPLRSEIASVLRDVLGDDTDGIAAELEDAEFLLGKEFWE